MTKTEAKRLICRDVAEILEGRDYLMDWIFEHPQADAKRLSNALQELVDELRDRGDTDLSRTPGVETCVNTN